MNTNAQAVEQWFPEDWPREYRLRLIPDCEPESPREWDNLGTMVCWHDRYTLGDEQPGGSPQDWMEDLAEDVDEGIGERIEAHCDRLWRRKYPHTGSQFDELLSELDAYRQARLEAVLDKHYFMLPLYLYDHGGITMSTGGFACPWDSGQVGWVYVSKADVRREYSVKRISPKVRDKVLDVLRSEVKVYAQYLEGDVYGYVLESRPEGCEDDDAWEDEDSCWGFYGDDPRTNGMKDYIDAPDDQLQDVLDKAEVDYD